jgi:hypothetical protein
MDEVAEAGVGMFAFKESMDTSTAHGRAMLEMAAVFAKLEREMIRERVMSGLKRAVDSGIKLGRPSLGNERDKAKAIVGAKRRDAILEAARRQGKGKVKIAKELGVGVGTDGGARDRGSGFLLAVSYLQPGAFSPGGSGSQGRANNAAQTIPVINDGKPRTRVDEIQLFNCGGSAAELAGPTRRHQVLGLVAATGGMGEDVIDGCCQRKEGSMVAFRLAPRNCSRQAGSHGDSRAAVNDAAAAEAASPPIATVERSGFRRSWHARGGLADHACPT